MESLLANNKAVVRRFNRECIEQGRLEAFDELIADDFINHTARPGISKAREGMVTMIEQVLRPAFPDMSMQIDDQVAEGDKVTSRKVLHATHRGEFMGIAATNRRIRMEIIDIVRLRNGQYVEHWSIMNMHGLLAQLTAE